jgi:cysteinyl-tRNA synthetase
MATDLQIYNTLSRQKEAFRPLNAPHVGMYVCGPTVYGEAHLGHARPYITFDVLWRYLEHKGYKVRYVRNITDVGHLENDADEGEDKIAKKARLEQLEPMEVVQLYTNSFHQSMRELNNRPPSIEPRASGHILEQIAMIEQLLANGFAYESNGSVYFDVTTYAQQHDYGCLSGRIVEDLIAGAGNERRVLEGQDEKRNAADFALWKKAQPEHIMRWPSPWSDGFPGWHIECSAMSTKYLGDHFDIHGGGMDLLFPHHESEIAQSQGSCGHHPVKYWMHNNMITINGQKMGKSLGNFITLTELFTGSHAKLAQAYSPMTVRFFILQAHYRSTLDFSNEALQGVEKGLKRFMEGIRTLNKLEAQAESSFEVDALIASYYDALNDDLNTPILIAQLYETIGYANKVQAQQESLNAADLQRLQQAVNTMVFDILGLQEEQEAGSQKLDGLMELLLELRAQAKTNKDWATSDAIRDRLANLGIQVKDSKTGSSWTLS